MKSEVLDRKIANMAEFERSIKGLTGEQLVQSMRNQANWQGTAIDEALTSYALGIWQSDDEFVADKVFRTLNVEAEAGHYYTFDSESIDIPTAGVVAENSMAPEIKLPELSKDEYRIKREGNGVWVSDQAVERAGINGFSAFQFASKIQIRGLKVTKEKRFFDQYFRTGLWTTNLQGVAPGPPGANQFLQWDSNNATPISDLRAAVARVKLLIGVKPTTLTIAEDAWNALIECEQTLDVLSAITGNPSMGVFDGSMVTTALIAQAIGINEVIIAGAVYRPKDGAAAVPFASKNALLTYSPKLGVTDIFTPSSGVIFQHADVGGLGDIGRVATHYFSERYSTWMDAFFNVDMKMTMAKGGAYLYSIIA